MHAESALARGRIFFHQTVIGVAKLADFSVNLNINPWVAVPDFEAATSEINHAVMESFRERNIVIPLPQREVRMLATG